MDETITRLPNLMDERWVLITHDATGIVKGEERSKSIHPFESDGRVVYYKYYDSAEQAAKRHYQGLVRPARVVVTMQEVEMDMEEDL